MQQTINKKNDSIALSISIAAHALLLLLFWWIVAWVELDPPPPPSEEGVMINFGFSDQGGGDNYHNTEEVGGEEQSNANNTPQSPSSPPQELITGQDPTYTVPPQQNTTPNPNNNNQNTTPTQQTPDPRFSMNNNNNNNNSNNNNNNAPDGPNEGPYNYGVLDGSPDSNGNSYGHNLSGWGWSKEPRIDRETQAGVIYYEIQLDANGTITTATYLSKYSTINTPSVVDKYRKRLLECELEAVGRVAKVTKGVVMFTFKY